MHRGKARTDTSNKTSDLHLKIIYFLVYKGHLFLFVNIIEFSIMNREPGVSNKTVGRI